MTYSSRLTFPKFKTGQINLRYGNTDIVFPLSSDELTVTNVFLEVLLDLSFDDLLEPLMVSLNSGHHEIVVSLFSFDVAPSKDGSNESQNVS